MRRDLRKTCLAIAAMSCGLFAATIGNVEANAETPSAGARLLIEQLGERTIAAIKLEHRVERRLQLLADGALVMDYRAMAKSVLDYAEVKVPAAREIEVREAVILYVSNQIIDKVEKVRPDKSEITAVEEKSPEMVQVAMALSGPQDTIGAVWTVRLTPSGWHVADLSMSGYSLAQHFGQILARQGNSIDQLMKYLKANSPLKSAGGVAAP